MDPTLAAVVVVAAAFAWSNGMHDAANAVATSLSTGALTPRVALLMAAVLNGVGAMLGIGIAELVGSGLLSLPVDTVGPSVVLVALSTALAWNLFTWRLGIPTSSTQALIAGLAGAGTAAGGHVDWRVIGLAVLIPTVLSCVVGFLGTWGLMSVLTWWWQDAAHERVLRWFRLAQSVSAATVSLGHGLQDGQKTIGAMMIALGASAGVTASSEDPVPLWARVLVAVALSVGTLAGGWPIIRTLARRVTRIDPVSGFAAEAVASTLLYVSGGVGTPLSTTITVTSGVVGAGVVHGVKTIRWATVRRIVIAWLATPVVTFAIAWLLRTLFG